MNDMQVSNSAATAIPTNTASAHSMPLIFVTGASRSGTTMLARMLGEHSSVRSFNELHYFGELWDPFAKDVSEARSRLIELATTLLVRETRGLWGGRPTSDDIAWAESVVEQLPLQGATPSALFAAVARRLAADAGKTWACEQTPRNIFYAERLLELYENAYIVHIVRDPRAVLASQKNRWKLRKLGADHLPVSEMLRNRVNYHPYTMSRLWAKANEEALRLRDRPRVRVVRFEDLAAEPEAESRKLCEFLGLPYEEAVLDVPKWGSSNVAHSSAEKGVSKDVVGKWRDTISDGEALICEKATAGVMQRLGYEPEFVGRTAALRMLPSLAMYPLHMAGVVALNPGRAWIQLRALARIKSPL
jgi:hypothetical protein